MKTLMRIRFSGAVVIAFMAFSLAILYGLDQQNQNASGAYSSTNPPSTSSSIQSTSSNNSSMSLSVKQIAGVYKWTNATTGAENPQLGLNTKMNNTIKIQNPTDTKHKLIIESQGKEVASSGDITPGASGQISFRPNGTGTFSYHCEYHPDTMKGEIKLVS
jgi:plastocyanin